MVPFMMDGESDRFTGSGPTRIQNPTYLCQDTFTKRNQPMAHCQRLPFVLKSPNFHRLHGPTPTRPRVIAMKSVVWIRTKPCRLLLCRGLILKPVDIIHKVIKNPLHHKMIGLWSSTPLQSGHDV